MTADKLIVFENKVKDLWESGDLPSLVHLSGGNEQELLDLFKLIKIDGGDWVFSTHRNHYHALLSGIPEDELFDKIRNGRSMFVYSKERNFFPSAILANTCGIAAGVALAIKEAGETGRVWCFIGDGGEENGHFYEAAMFVEGRGLPCTFIIEDNDRSVDTPTWERRGDVSGLENFFKCVLRYKYEPAYPHAGSGCKFQIKFKEEAIERLRAQ